MSSVSSASSESRLDPVWSELRELAEAAAQREPAIAGLMHRLVLAHPTLEKSLAVHLGAKLGNEAMSASQVTELLHEAYVGEPAFAPACRADMQAVMERDPACRSLLQPMLFFKGFLAISAWRAAHWHWQQQAQTSALYLQNRIAEVFNVDIHPAARIGKGLMMDHATGIVIGETAVVDDNVSMLHGVTLGGTGRDKGDRHPKIGCCVLISVGAKVLGNIRIGDCAKIGAGSVVLTDVPAYTTAVGVPARIVGKVVGEPARAMDHRLNTDASDSEKSESDSDKKSDSEKKDDRS